ncbi:ABC transporter substrate-binding protein [Nesterenkonia pannonica]|uniref:ABC transporter substrate-binding protein n=1 Tax=Nesterenkonia pannonica TaxID=1548602 RepID=UPI00216484F4|nr:ABC transporter substrate-binding protein [Nesterenkonia pannonica]
MEPDGELAPMLAESWELSEDRLSLTLQLREDVTFSDGEPFNAEAVKANIEHFQEANGPMGTALKAVESVSAPEEFTAVLELSEPDPSLEMRLSTAGGFMGSPAALGTDEVTTSPVGSGPYVVDETRTVTGSRIAFSRNEEYWGSSSRSTPSNSA